MDFHVVGKAAVSYNLASTLDLEKEYPGISQQPQTCAELGFTTKHISPLYNTQERTFTDPETEVEVTNAYWKKPATLQ